MNQAERLDRGFESAYFETLRRPLGQAQAGLEWLGIVQMVLDKALVEAPAVENGLGSPDN